MKFDIYSGIIGMGSNKGHILIFNVRNLGSFGSVLSKCAIEPKQKYRAGSQNKKKNNE